MVRGTDNIELRSEKARSTIGQIPPIIVRMGIAIMSIMIIIYDCPLTYLKLKYREYVIASLPLPCLCRQAGGRQTAGRECFL
jgi:hypothetical protein